LYQRNQTSAATARLDRLIQDSGRTVEIVEAHYLRGLCRAREGALEAARKDFKRAAGKNGRDDLTARCNASLAAIAYRQGRWAEAADYYDEALPDLPDEPPVDQILYSAGVAMQRAGRWRDGALQFARIVAQFGRRPIAADARRMVAWQHAYFAIQLGAFSSANNARKAADAFKQRGLKSVQAEHHPRAGQSLWIVMAGQHPTYADATRGLARLQAVQSGACIIPRP